MSTSKKKVKAIGITDDGIETEITVNEPVDLASSNPDLIPVSTIQEPRIHVNTFCRHSGLRASTAGRLVKASGGLYYNSRTEWTKILNRIG